MHVTPFAVLVFTITTAFITAGCEKTPEPTAVWQGSGVADFYDDVPVDARLIRLFYFVPPNASPATPIVFFFHGAERNAIEYRNALKAIAAERQFIVVAPEFSATAFSLNDYQLGRIFSDGEAPSIVTRIPELEWTFSIVPRLWDFVKLKTGTSQNHCSMVGHSAGAQFLHRFLLFKPDFFVHKAVLSAAGWYTLPDFTANFPYGLQLTNVQPQQLPLFFNRNIVVQVGSNDNNPNAPSLRRTPEADAQGLHRLERAQFFFNACEALANQNSVVFNWDFRVALGLNHSFSPAMQESVQLLFP